jgi:hypothetical protein
MKQTRLLAKTFFGRFFESELMPPGLPQVQLVIWSIALLAAPGLLFPTRFAAKYITLRFNRAALAEALLVDRLLFITLTMTTLGVVALVIWDGMFPDRRDARILTVLPLRGRVLVAARLLALSALAGIFLVGVNAAPTLFYGSQIARYGAATNVIRGVMAHLVATTLAGAFVFSLLVALQGIVLNLGGRRASERLSVLLQVFFVVALLQMIFFLPRMRSLLPGDLSTVWSDPWLRWIPSIWFLGLYDVLGCRRRDGSCAVRARRVRCFNRRRHRTVRPDSSPADDTRTRERSDRQSSQPGHRARYPRALQAHMPARCCAVHVRVHTPLAHSKPEPSPSAGHVRGRRVRPRGFGDRASRDPRRPGELHRSRCRGPVGAARAGVPEPDRPACRVRDSGGATGELGREAARAGPPRGGD